MKGRKKLLLRVGILIVLAIIPTFHVEIINFFINCYNGIPYVIKTIKANSDEIKILFIFSQIVTTVGFFTALSEDHSKASKVFMFLSVPVLCSFIVIGSVMRIYALWIKHIGPWADKNL